MKKFSCILLTNSNKKLSSPIVTLVNKLYNVRLISYHSWENSKLTDEIIAIFNSRKIDYLFDLSINNNFQYCGK